jgi:hypothetical protein
LASKLAVILFMELGGPQECSRHFIHKLNKKNCLSSRLRLQPCSLRTTPIIAATAVSPSSAERLSGGWQGNKSIPSCVVNMINFMGAPDAPDGKSHRCIGGGCDRDTPDGWAGVADLSAGIVCPTNQLHAWHCKKASHLHQTPRV